MSSFENIEMQNGHRRQASGRWRGGFCPVLLGDIVAEIHAGDLREWMTMTDEQRLDWMSRALRYRRSEAADPGTPRAPRTALPLLGPRSTLGRYTDAPRAFSRWFLYMPPESRS